VKATDPSATNPTNWFVAARTVIAKRDHTSSGSAARRTSSTIRNEVYLFRHILNGKYDRVSTTSRDFHPTLAVRAAYTNTDAVKMARPQRRENILP